MSLANLLPPPHHSVFNPCHVISLDCSCIPILHLDHFALHSSHSWLNHVLNKSPHAPNQVLLHIFVGLHMNNICLRISIKSYVFFRVDPQKHEKMEVSSWNRGAPKSSFSMGFSIINHPFWGTNIYGNPRMDHKNRRAAYSCIPNMRLSTFHSPVGLTFDDKLNLFINWWMVWLLRNLPFLMVNTQ